MFTLLHSHNLLPFPLTPAQPHAGHVIVVEPGHVHALQHVNGGMRAH